ncbi:MAG: PspC domain-containing protein [Crenarchaeota archaeon]|nr:MAG: PspC domain-containing protein [Thermoproteota archaeon]
MWRNAITKGFTMKKNTEDKVLLGVCSGIADTLGVDSLLIRVLYAIVTLSTGFVPGLVVYIVLALLMK